MNGVAITGAAAVLDGSLAAALDALPEPVRARAARAERVTQLALATCGPALTAAGLVRPDGAPRPRHGVAFGTAFGCFLTNAGFQRRLAAEGVRAASPRLFAATVSNAAAGEVSIAYRLGGPAVTLSAGGAAGLLAIGHAADLVAIGRAEAMVAGGMDARGPELERWLAAGGLPARDVPMREGAAIVVLEACAAPGRRDRVLGHAASFAPGPALDAVIAAARVALDDGGVRAADLALIALAGSPVPTDPLAGGLRAALGIGSRPRVLLPDARHASFAASGPLALLAALAVAPPGAPLLVVQVCPSGHVAAVVAARAEGA